MRCSCGRRRLARYLEQALRPRARAAVDRHLEECPACRAELSALRRTAELLAELELSPAPAGLWEGVDSRRWPALWPRRLLVAAALALVTLVLAWPTPQPPDQAIGDHYRVAAGAPLGNPALAEVMAFAEARR